MFIAFIIRMNHNRCIAKVSFRSCSCNLHMSASISKRVLDMVELSIVVLMLNFYVAKCPIVSTPIDHVVSTNNQTIIVQMDKSFFNRFLKSFVHSKTLTFPSWRHPKFTQLTCHNSGRFRFPSPSAL